MNGNQGTQPPCIDAVELVAETRWLNLQTLTYRDAVGKQRKWDMVTRQKNLTVTDDGRTSKRGAEGVVIVPVLRSVKNNVLDTILVEQFRPPQGRVTIEFPGGLIDEHETPEEAALRELLEETGYRGNVAKKSVPPPRASPELCMTPGITDESLHVVVVEVDLDNHGPPVAQPDEGEYIQLKRVKLSDGLKAVLEQKDFRMPLLGLYMFALGLEMGKSL